MSYRTALSEVLRTVIVPTAEATGTRAKFPRASVTALGRAGLLGLTVSTEFGGLGMGLPEAAEVVARIARICPATAAVLQSHYAAVAVIESYGSDWVRGEIAAGRHLGSLALAEDDPAEQGVQGSSGRHAPPPRAPVTWSRCVPVNTRWSRRGRPTAMSGPPGRSPGRTA